VYRIARDAGRAFLQLYFDVPFDVVLARNAQRTGAALIPEAVVMRMRSRLEPPQQRGWDTAVVVGAAGLDEEAFLLAWRGAKSPGNNPPSASLLQDGTQNSAAAPGHDARHRLDLEMRRLIGVLVQVLFFAFVYEIYPLECVFLLNYDLNMNLFLSKEIH
jgi:hypothetical protein